MPDRAERPPPPPHGAQTLLWGATADAHNAEHDSFPGGKASNCAREAILRCWRDTLREVDDDPDRGGATGFNLPGRIRGALPRTGGRDTAAAVHNKAVVQGSSQAPRVRDVRHRTVLTIGTGLGNAGSTNRDGG